MRREARFVRELPRYYPGLDEHVLLTKSELDLTVKRADGRIQPLQVVEQEDAEAWASRHGRATAGLVQRMAGARPDETLRFAATFDSLAGREDLAARLLSDDDEVAIQARSEHAEIIAAMTFPPSSRRRG